MLAIAGVAPATAAVQNHELADDARAAMEKATAYIRSIATEGGYLWRYSPDLKERAGEEPATATQIWVQPPGTPSMGMAFLRAYEATGDARYLDVAKAAADALAAGQFESGGWDYRVDFDPAESAKRYRRIDVGRISAAEAAKRYNLSVYDDDNTQSALRFLVAVADAAKDSTEPRDLRIREARDYGLAKLIEAQRPNGGWPQAWNGRPVNPADYPVQPARFPAEWPRTYPKQKYYSCYTLNDNTQRDCILALLDAARRLGRPEYRAAALQGGDFLLHAHLPEPQAAWAQQYNAQMEPAWARSFEPPAVCSSESSGAMRVLVDLYLETGDEKYLRPIPRAIAWLQRSEIAPGRWARFYEMGTNRPIYGDRDGTIHYQVEELSPERRTGYGWQGGFGVAGAVAYYENVTKAGRAAWLDRKETAPPTGRQGTAGAQSLEPRVRAVLAALDAQSRWIARSRGAERIQTRLFIEHLGVLCDYLEATRRQQITTTPSS